jgi:hypothetical protein
MANTISEQTRKAVTIGSIPQFQIEAKILAKGDLPTTAVFVFQIINPEDSKLDAFTRVAAIADFSDIGEDRITAIANDQAFYRKSNVTFLYPDVETADNAQKTLKDRIDELVVDHDLFLASFDATNEQTVHPVQGEAVFTAAVTDYVAKRAATTAAEVTRDAAEAKLAASVTAASSATDQLVLAQARLTNCQTDKQAYDNMLTAFSLLKTDGDLFAGTGEAGAFSTQAGIFITSSNTFHAAADKYRTDTNSEVTNAAAKAAYDAATATYGGDVATFDGQKTGFDANLNSFKQELTTAQTAIAAATAAQAVFATHCATLQTEVNTAQTAKNEADTAVENNRTAFADAQSAVESAQAAENAALAEVQTLKPDFDPLTV